MKDLIPFIEESLNNLHEKNFNEYIDVPVYKELIPPEWQSVAEKLAKKVSEYKFPDNANDTYHPFIDLEDESVKELGLDTITVCAYKGYEFPFNPINSNYMYMCYVNKNLTIDIYNTVNLSEQDVFNCIVQEFYNFCRDASWLKDGEDIYEMNMENMKNILQEK